MGKERGKLEKNPKTLQLLRNTNTVVRITRTTKRLEVVEKPGKNRGKKMGPPKPMNTYIAIPREARQQKLSGSSLTRTIST
ncbi:hypothetical protein Tagg_0569 [Thermosphaera aggregans DSM 11486]|uniref:Uncharacterized protein n=1 Tax=Thermosphaera aggregans (strain DSM 11486 / M11TL) TaxID=633148 RepID=D5U143_THEAM|nr:hypothetical protein Tagg_0569 [Thermosphaera aggregans DSM 11486]